MVLCSPNLFAAVVIATLCLSVSAQIDRSQQGDDESSSSRRFGFDDDGETDSRSMSTTGSNSDSAPLCPVSLSQSFELIRALNNFRMSHGLPAINISRSLMSTGCAHMRDIMGNKDVVNGKCGIHSWSSCCYPTDHSNPKCMHRKALQVTTTLNWNLYNVASYELAYEWAGGSFSPVRAIDMFVSNPAHRQFILQEDLWSSFEWRAIGAAVGVNSAFIWFGTLKDPNGDFDQFEVEPHVMELPGCICNASPIMWTPPPIDSLISNSSAATGPIYTVSESDMEQLEMDLLRLEHLSNTTNSNNATNMTGTPIPESSQNITNLSSADPSVSVEPATQSSVTLDQFLKSLTMNDGDEN